MTTNRSSVILRAVALGTAIVAVIVVGTIGIVARRSPSAAGQPSALAANPDLDPGTALSGQAPGFTLTDQFGRPVSLRSYRGRVVILAFNDSECTTICPLTTTAMVLAKTYLGAAGSQVQLLGVDANPTATSVSDVRSYSEVHGMMHQWRFATGSPAQLRRVWNAYHIEVAIDAGQIDHTPAVFVIDPQGRLAKLYETQQAYAAVDQLGQLLANEASSLLPGHPRVDSSRSYSEIQPLSPGTPVALPEANGGTLALGHRGSAQLLLFFATWDSEVTNLGARLQALDEYAARAGPAGLPPLAAVDEGSVEPSPTALPAFLHGLSRPLSYPVAIDQAGRVADGYGVQDEPWLVLSSPSGQIAWYYDVSTGGWPTTRQLRAHVRAALAAVPKAPATAAQAERAVAGSPAPLAALHQQAGQLIGSYPELAARLRALRGYPMVLNVWASWCGPCRQEFGLFANASAAYGKQVAFLGADYNDSSGAARSFLAQHPVSYPSYSTSVQELGSLAQIIGLPTTVYVNRAGKVVDVHSGQYVALGTLNSDISTYALGR
jgi:cytochrome oxidase Cu insertion factor (SCO1/SenC/PrrC family)/thiol-disulfide isomerase/thioredoxin